MIFQSSKGLSHLLVLERLTEAVASWKTIFPKKLKEYHEKSSSRYTIWTKDVWGIIWKFQVFILNCRNHETFKALRYPANCCLHKHFVRSIYIYWAFWIMILPWGSVYSKFISGNKACVHFWEHICYHFYSQKYLLLGN